MSRKHAQIKLLRINGGKYSLSGTFSVRSAGGTAKALSRRSGESLIVGLSDVFVSFEVISLTLNDGFVNSGVTLSIGDSSFFLMAGDSVCHVDGKWVTQKAKKPAPGPSALETRAEKIGQAYSSMSASAPLSVFCL